MGNRKILQNPLPGAQIQRAAIQCLPQCSGERFHIV
jgi:hypothetical protein